VNVLMLGVSGANGLDSRDDWRTPRRSNSRASVLVVTGLTVSRELLVQSPYYGSTSRGARAVDSDPTSMARRAA